MATPRRTLVVSLPLLFSHPRLTFANNSTTCTGAPGRLSGKVMPDRARAAMSPALSSHKNFVSVAAVHSREARLSFSIVEMVER
jgi:hypothetical protein